MTMREEGLYIAILMCMLCTGNILGADETEKSAIKAIEMLGGSIHRVDE